MTPSEYMKLALRTEKTPIHIMDWDEVFPAASMYLSKLNHAALGMTTEAGEFTDALKKRYIYGKPLDKTNLLEEIGDMLWFQALALQTLGYTFEDAMEANIQKLAVRYPNEFSPEKALNRDLEKERAALEGEAGPRLCKKCDSKFQATWFGDEFCTLACEETFYADRVIDS